MMEFLKSITRERNGPLIQRYPVIRSTRINCPSAFNYPIPLPDIQLTTFHYANHFYERTGEFFGISILLENLFRAPLSWGKSIATLTKKQGKWSVINRRTYYESKAISGLIARILIDIFDSSPGRGEGKVVAIDGTRVPTTIVRARSVIYIEWLNSSSFRSCSFKFEREKFRSNKHLFPIDRVLRRVILESLLDEILLKISPRLARYLDPEKTAPQKESLRDFSRIIAFYRW